MKFVTMKKKKSSGLLEVTRNWTNRGPHVLFNTKAVIFLSFSMTETLVNCFAGFPGHTFTLILEPNADTEKSTGNM